MTYRLKLKYSLILWYKWQFWHKKPKSTTSIKIMVMEKLLTLVVEKIKSGYISCPFFYGGFFLCATFLWIFHN